MKNPYDVYVSGQDGSINAGLSGVFGAMQRKNQMIAQQERQEKEFDAQNALNIEASRVFSDGSPDEIASFMIANPSAKDKIISADKFLNDRTKESKISAARDIVMGMNPMESLMRSAVEIQNEGGNADDTVNMSKQPTSVQIAASEKLWAALDPKGFKSWSSSHPEKMSSFETAKIDAKKIDQQLRAEELSIKRNENKIKNERDYLKSEQLQQKIDTSKSKISQINKDKIADYEDSISTIDATIDTVNRLLSDKEGLENAAGWQSNFPTAGGGRAAGFEATLETLKSQAFLSQVKQLKGMGALSENEGKKLSSAVGALDISMSDKMLSDELGRIKKTLDTAKAKLASRAPIGYNKSSSQLSDDELLSKYGGGG